MQFTFNIPDQHVPRVRDWARSTLPSDGTDPDGNPVQLTYTNAELSAEFQRLLRAWIKDQVQSYELQQQHEQAYQNYTRLEVEDVLP